MKKILTSFVIIVVFSTKVLSQVDEIGLFFEGSGYVENIFFEDNRVKVNFKKKDSIESSNVLLADPKTKKLASGLFNLSQLRIGMEIEIEGDQFLKKGYIIAKKVKITDFPKKITIKEGRIHDIFAEFAMIDGHKVKMKKDGVIVGKKKDLYKGKTFNALNELKLGDFADVIGIYDPQGYILASEIMISPDLDRNIDKKYAYINRGSEINEILDNWNDLTKRKNYFGMTMGERGTIIQSTTLQSYVEKVGMNLIPEYLKKKINFRFIAFQNDEWNANASPDGLVSIYSGFLNSIENEAQLAAVLGHEIAHVMYEHSANGEIEEAKVSRKMEKSALSQQAVVNTVKVFSNWVDIPLTKNNYTSKIKFRSNLDSISNALEKYIDSKNVHAYAQYNVEQESQSDRVGLYLMTKAGYDSREAMKVWRDKFNSKRKPLMDLEMGSSRAVTGLSTFAHEFGKYRKPPTMTNLGVFLIKNSLKNSSNKNNENSFYNDGRIISHPENVKRFSNLNEFTSLYYANFDNLSSAKTGREELYNSIMAGYRESIAAYEKIINDLERKNIADFNKQKAYLKERDRIALQQSTKNPSVLNFHDYNIAALLTLKKIIDKNKCSTDGLETILLEVYNDLDTKQSKFVNEFKSGKISPNEKVLEFTKFYLWNKNYNDLLMDIAARIKICDAAYLKSITNELMNNKFYNLIAPDKYKMSDIYFYLKAKEEEQANNKK